MTSNSGFPAALLVAGLTAAVLVTVSSVAFGGSVATLHERRRLGDKDSR